MAWMTTIRKTAVLWALLVGAGVARAERAPDRGLDETLREVDMARSATSQNSRYWQDVGARFFKSMNLERARHALQKAVEIDPSNKEAMRLLARVDALLGVRQPVLKTAMEQLGDEHVVGIQERIKELRYNLTEAARLIEEASKPGEKVTEDLLARQLMLADRAYEYAERARELMKWVVPLDKGGEVDIRAESESAEALLAEADRLRVQKSAVLEGLQMDSGRKRVESRKQEEQRLEERRIEMLLDRVQMLFDEEDFAESEKLAGEVLRLDPINGRATEIWAASREQQHLKREHELRGLRVEQKLLIDERLREANVPYSDFITYPKDWERILARSTEDSAVSAEPEWKQAIRKMLDRKVTFEFKETPLAEAIAFLQTLTKTTIILDPAAAEEGAAPDTMINLRVNEMPLDLALKWILRLADLDYTLKDEAVFVSTPKNLAGEVDLNIYDVRDLTYTVSTFPGPELVVTDATVGGGGGGGPINLGETVEAEAMDASSLAELIMSRVRPGEWADELGTSIEERNGKLVVMQRPEVHRLIAKLLQTFRQAQTLQVVVEARFIEVRDEFLEDIGVDFADLPGAALSAAHPMAAGGTSVGFHQLEDRTGNPAGEYEYWVRSTGYTRRDLPFGARLPAKMPRGSGQGLAFQFRFVGNITAQAILHATRMEEKGDILLAPRLTMFNNQRAYIMAAQQRAYIADYDISGTVYDPTIATILVGTVLDVRPTVSHDRRYITLNMRPATADQLNLVHVSTYIHGGAYVFPLALPSIRLRSARTTVTVPDGGTLLLSGLMESTKFDASTGVPFFSDLPVVGRLFGTDLKQRYKLNLIMLVAPHLILFEEEEAKL